MFVFLYIRSLIVQTATSIQMGNKWADYVGYFTPWHIGESIITDDENPQ